MLVLFAAILENQARIKFWWIGVEKGSFQLGWGQGVFFDCKIWTNPLVLPARLSGAAAGNFAHRYIGKVCCLLLVRAEYIGRTPGRCPEGTVNCSSCYGFPLFLTRPLLFRATQEALGPLRSDGRFSTVILSTLEITCEVHRFLQVKTCFWLWETFKIIQKIFLSV